MSMDVQRGKHLSVGFLWVDFVINNTDIMCALNKAPLSVHLTGPGQYSGKAFGVKIKIEQLEKDITESQGYVRSLSDVRLPFGLGRTYTIASHTYYTIDNKTTSLDLQFKLETNGMMRLYLWMRKGSVLSYIDQICSDIENAAEMLETEDEKVNIILNEEQLDRVRKFQKKMSHAHSGVQPRRLEAEGVVRLSLVEDVMLVETEALMPDKELLTANNKVQRHSEVIEDLQTSACQLASLNNPVFGLDFAVRGPASPATIDKEFRQVAFEFGYDLYQKYFSGDIKSIMPILLHYGDRALLRFDVDEAVDGLPWEALHDGKDFIALEVRFVRSIGISHRSFAIAPENPSNLGILLVGSDPRGDLPGTTTEINAISQLLAEVGTQKVETLTGSDANRHNIMDRLSSGNFNVLHYSGHSVFDTDHPYQSYLELANDTKLYLHEFEDFVHQKNTKNQLSLVFLNSCQSGRVGMEEKTGKNLSMCRILRHAGVSSVIGMLWNVSDAAAAQVASTFYNSLVTSEQFDVAEAMRQTREKVASERAWADGSWLAPILYE